MSDNGIDPAIWDELTVLADKIMKLTANDKVASLVIITYLSGMISFLSRRVSENLSEDV